MDKKSRTTELQPEKVPGRQTESPGNFSGGHIRVARSPKTSSYGRQRLRVPSQENPADSKLTSDGMLCKFGGHAFVPISWVCQKQMTVSHSNTEAEVISSDTCLKMECADVEGSCDSRVGATSQPSKGRPFASAQTQNTKHHAGIQ